MHNNLGVRLPFQKSSRRYEALMEFIINILIWTVKMMYFMSCNVNNRYGSNVSLFSNWYINVSLKSEISVFLFFCFLHV